jgi:hypothetical protein
VSVYIAGTVYCDQHLCPNVAPVRVKLYDTRGGVCMEVCALPKEWAATGPGASTWNTCPSCMAEIRAAREPQKPGGGG